jgi:hypothetical protein
VQTPTQGRIVIVEGDLVSSNGADTAPAIVTRTWGQNSDGTHTINATTFPDNSPSRVVSSIRLYPDREAAMSGDARKSFEGATVAYWPPRVG